MKKQLILITVLVLLLTMLLPAAALAAKPAELAVEVRNQTGAVAELSLTDAVGNVTYKSLPVGVSSFDLTEGRYTYYASTACGAKSGPFNASTKEKILFLGCDNGPVVQYEACQFVGIWPNHGSYYDMGTDYRWQHLYGGYDSYTFQEFVDWYASYGWTSECLVGLQASDYWDGVKVPDTKP